MTDDSGSKGGGGDQLAEEAALWFARRRGPDADALEPAFQAWIARGALHLAAYNRAAEIFAMGKCLTDATDSEEDRKSMAMDARPVPSSHRDRRLLILTALLSMMLGGWLVWRALPTSATADRPATLAGASRDRPLQLATRLGEIRVIALEDGSRITLDSDSLVVAALGPRRRDLRLERGRARFDVAHDPRPFVVAAGPGTVTARGTIFDVSLSDEHKVAVHLIRGRVDVEMPDARSMRAARKIISLRPGDALEFAVATIDPGLSRTDRWTETSVEFDKSPVSAIIGQANARSSVKIRLADPAIGAIPISGTFRTNDGQALADRLAQLLDLEVDRSNGIDIVLGHRRD